MNRIALIIGTAFCTLFSLQADDLERMLGLWKLNVPQSKVQGQPLVSGEMKTERIAEATLRTEMSSVTVIGEKQNRTTTRICDGKEHSPEGSTGNVTYICKADGVVTKRGGKVFSELGGVFSPDGKKQTVTLKLLNSEGKWVEQVFVYEKQ